MEPYVTAAVATGIVIVILLLSNLMAVFSLHNKVDDLQRDIKANGTINEALIRSNGSSIEGLSSFIAAGFGEMNIKADKIEAQTKHIPTRDQEGKFRKRQ